MYMVKIGTKKIRVNNSIKDVGIYSLDDTNISYKGVRVQTPKGVGCLNFVSNGGDIPAVKIQTRSGVKHLKSYSYSTTRDVEIEESKIAWAYGSETVAYNNITWTNIRVYTLLTFDVLPRVVKINFAIAVDPNYAGYAGTVFRLLYNNGNGWIISSLTIQPNQAGVDYAGSLNFSEFDLDPTQFRFVFLPDQSRGQMLLANKTTSYVYKKNVTEYH